MTIRKAWWLTTLLLTISAACAGMGMCPAAANAQQPVPAGSGAYRVAVGGTAPGVPGPWYPAPTARALGGMAYGPAGNTAAPAAYQPGPQYVEVAPGLYQPAVQTPAEAPMMESGGCRGVLRFARPWLLGGLPAAAGAVQRWGLRRTPVVRCPRGSLVPQPRPKPAVHRLLAG